MNRNIRLRVFWGVQCFLILAINYAYADDSLNGIKNKCLSCHRYQVDGVVFRGPQLGGFSEGYILAQLYNFKEGRRGAGSSQPAAMADAVRDLTGQEFKNLAKWAASLDKEKIQGTLPPRMFSGAKLYADKCRGCHNSFMGRLMTGSPRLDYLSADYVARQLNFFDQGFRSIRNPTKHQNKMKAVVQGLSPEDFGLIIDYIREMTISVKK